MMLLSLMTGFTVRSLMAQGVSFPAAIKQSVLLRQFWIQVACTAIALIGMVLYRQKHSILTDILQMFVVVFVLTAISTAAGFWEAGMELAEKKSKSDASK
jgi:hypothetical protein